MGVTKTTFAGGLLLGALLLGSLGTAWADVPELQQRLEAQAEQEAAVLAPELFRKAQRAVDEAEKAAASGSSRLPDRLETASKRLDELEEAADRARRLWEGPLRLRDRARAAGADTASSSYATAENILNGAARKLEAGRRDAAERQATSLSGLYDQALKEAVQHDLVGRSRQLLVQAEKSKSAEYTPRSYVRALDAVTRTEELIEAQPGEPDAAMRAQAELARREVEHTLFLLDNIKGSCDGPNRARIESIILEWEGNLERILVPLGLERDFSQGMGADLQRVQVQTDGLLRERNRLRIDLARRTDQADSLQRVISELRSHVRNFEGLVAELQPFREEANTVAAVRGLFAQSEGKVLVEGRDVVLRLHGLRFASGKSTLPDDSHSLLEKIAEAVRAFPGAYVVVEGHTDATGGEAMNQRLSTERAEAVRAYLERFGGVDADRITSVGHGPSRPVASNETETGRALNRRIDVIIARPD